MQKNNNLTLPSSQETEQSVQIFKAFGDQTRYRILFLLFEDKLSVNEIAELVGISQSAVSHQLKILRQTNLVIGKREGQNVIYELADRHIINIFKQVKEHIAED